MNMKIHHWRTRHAWMEPILVRLEVKPSAIPRILSLHYHPPPWRRCHHEISWAFIFLCCWTLFYEELNSHNHWILVNLGINLWLWILIWFNALFVFVIQSMVLVCLGLYMENSLVHVWVVPWGRTRLCVRSYIKEGLLIG